MSEHVHQWTRRQNVTSSGYALPPYETCDCGDARALPDSPTAREQAAEVERLSPLDDFLRAFREDGNDWWRIPQGDQLNLFEDAVDRMERAEAAVARVEALADEMSTAIEPDGSMSIAPVRWAADAIRAALRGADQ